MCYDCVGYEAPNDTAVKSKCCVLHQTATSFIISSSNTIKQLHEGSTVIELFDWNFRNQLSPLKLCIQLGISTNEGLFLGSILLFLLRPSLAACRTALVLMKIFPFEKAQLGTE